jgi:hypothetical protein
MEFTIRVLVVIVLIVIAFVVFVALIGVWGGDASAMIKGLTEWFKQVLSGGYKLPAGSSSGGGTGLTNLPGIGK